MPASQQQPPRPPPPNPSAANANANVNGRRTLAGRISALSTSLRMHSPRTTTHEGERDDRAGDDERGAWAETSTLVDASTSPSRGYLTGRGGFGNFHADGRPPPSAPDSETQEQDIPWPRGRSREPRRGSNSTGRGGYGNIAAGRNAHAAGWSYSAQEQEVLRAHAEARRLAIPIGRGGYGNIAHARALEAAAARSQSVDPVAAPTSLPFSVRLPVRLTGARARARRRGSPSFSLSGADDSDSDDSEKSSR
ncbi:hypothetical protein K438DRAFT_2000503 [Mycena galopus ATCC 62051]|nr:hypothetical protein K438DRAFT_2000503 [Mycena galopus ATCC 62051]